MSRDLSWNIVVVFERCSMSKFFLLFSGIVAIFSGGSLFFVRRLLIIFSV